jgi:kinesin family member C2/C3
MKSYSEWKKTGGTGSWKYGGIIKQANLSKSFMKRNSERSTSSLSRSFSMNECEILSDDHSFCGNNSANSNELVSYNSFYIYNIPWFSKIVCFLTFILTFY